MNEIIKAILDSFKHLTREILIYFVSGFYFIMNIFLIDYFYYNESLFKYFTTGKIKLIFLVIASYIIGHVIMGIMFFLFECNKWFVGWLSKCLKEYKEVKEKDQMDIFYNGDERYKYFIERYDLLCYFRWNLSGAMLISFVALIIYCFKGHVWQIEAVTALNLIGFLIVMLLSLQTETDLQNKIEELKRTNHATKSPNSQ